MIANREAERRTVKDGAAGPRRWGSLLFVLTLAFGSSGFAQSPKGLTDVELKGKGMFQQRCSVCHLPLVVDDDSTYGPKLNAKTVAGKEPVIREFIRRGTSKMPGFQYGLMPEEIDSIIAYLKTVQ